ncbi:MAG: hypothetical protein JXA77_06055 [Bacteroidales bacterium]|nr:hypothetical protein [Bacteroidales bacterium]MBN2820602.1 hypothetical protein [Bacteroidales bacterium]
MKLAAKILSVLFHPIFMPLLGIFIIFNSGIYEAHLAWEVKKYTYLISSLFSILMPVSFITMLLFLNQVQNFEMTERRERVIPLFLTTVSLFFLYFFLQRVLPIKIIQGFCFATAAISALLLIISLRFKISMHLIALGGITGLILAISKVFQADLFYIFMLFLLISGLVASSRYYLKAHTLTELSSGYLVGFAGSLSIILGFIQFQIS